MALDALPVGVRLMPNLLGPEQEAALARAVADHPWEACGTHRCQHYGWRAGEPEADARFLGALPDWAAPLVSRLHVLAVFDYAPDHLVVRELGAGALAELRRGQSRTLAVLVLQGDLPLAFRRRESSGLWHLTLPRRGLLILSESFERAWDRTAFPPGAPEPEAPILTFAFRRQGSTKSFGPRA